MASSPDGSTWTDIEDVTVATYAPKDGDAGKYLRATAEYKDGESTETAKTAEVVSAHAVLAHRSQNAALRSLIRTLRRKGYRAIK